MSTKELLLQEINQVPDFLLGEVLDFIQFLKAKHLKETIETAVLSESALSKDWLTPEEERAWQDLSSSNALLDRVGAGKWVVTVQPAQETEPIEAIRGHIAFLNGYASEDEGLYDDVLEGKPSQITNHE